MVKHSQSEPITLKLSQIQPYWRNPRNITSSVNKVKASIEKYGYANPIIVDKNHVIITGHSRYRALQFLGTEEVDVIVTDMDAKLAHEYRLVDNKTGEYATWTAELNTELENFDETLKVAFFPELGLDSQMDIREGGGNPTPAYEEDLELELLCPYCIEPFVKKQSELLGE